MLKQKPAILCYREVETITTLCLKKTWQNVVCLLTQNRQLTTQTVRIMTYIEYSLKQHLAVLIRILSTHEALF